MIQTGRPARGNSGSFDKKSLSLEDIKREIASITERVTRYKEAMTASITQDQVSHILRRMSRDVTLLRSLKTTLATRAA